MKLICPDCKQEVRSFVGHACMLNKSKSSAPVERATHKSGEGLPSVMPQQPGLKPKKNGRPLAKDADKTLAATKPWEKEGVSRRTWYRRLKEGK